MDNKKNNTPLIPWNSQGPETFPVYLDTRHHGIVQRLIKYFKLNPEPNYNHDHDEIQERK